MIEGDYILISCFARFKVLNNEICFLTKKKSEFYLDWCLTHIVFFICSSSFKEPSAHVTSVKTILESHASYLMSGKELSKLVAFVKGTQFDLVVGKSFF